MVWPSFSMSRHAASVALAALKVKFMLYLYGITVTDAMLSVHPLIGAAKPGCDILKPHFDSGIRFADKNNPQPDDPLWGAGVAGGVKWDGTFYRDLTRYPAGAELFWSAYFKPGSAPGIKLGYWFNFGSGWSHLANDDPAQILTGASQRIYWDSGAGHWCLVIEATMFVTYAVVNVWTGFTQAVNDPVGQYARQTD